MLRAPLASRQAGSHHRHSFRSQPLAAPGTLGCTEPPANSPASPQMKQHLAVSAIGSDRTGMVHELTRVISESGGNISESRMANLGTEFAMLLLVSGNWHSLAKLETELKRLADTGNLSIHLKRTEPRTPRTDMLPYSIDVVCLDHSGIVSGLAGFFATRGIDIAEVLRLTRAARGHIARVEIDHQLPAHRVFQAPRAAARHGQGEFRHPGPGFQLPFHAFRILPVREWRRG